MDPTIESTIAFIKKAHAGQLDKGGKPYWLHPVAVMNLLPAGATDDERHAALLHDVLEDTPTTVEDLRRAGYSKATIDIVQLVTRPKAEPRATYNEWIQSIATSGNIGAIRVKMADTLHNASPERAAQLPPHERGIAKRYERSIPVLQKALEALEFAAMEPVPVVLSDEAHQHLIARLDDPPEPSDRLRKLMQTPASWDKKDE